MAIQGTYNFKGIELPEAYLQVTSVNYATNSSKETVKTKDAEYEDDGNGGQKIKSEAVYEQQWIKKQYSSCLVRVFKDKNARESDPNGHLTDFKIDLELKVNTSAKNNVNQAYDALKKLDGYEEYTDV